MIRNKYLTFLGMGLLFMASACNDGYEKEPVEHFTLDYVFSRVDSAGIQSRYFLNNIYLEHLYSGYNRIDGDFLDAASDDAISIDRSLFCSFSFERHGMGGILSRNSQSEYFD